MSKKEIPVTQAIRFLKQKSIPYEPYFYEYEEKGDTSQTARELGIDEHSIIKTLVFETDSKEIIIMLQHGDLSVSQKELTRQIGVKSIEKCDEKKAQNATGYQFGGTSPFGTKKPISVYAEASIFDLEKIYINGGKRGFIIGISTADLNKALIITKVNANIAK
jgi:Cys-tRNA(Pro) deacylase